MRVWEREPTCAVTAASFQAPRRTLRKRWKKIRCPTAPEPGPCRPQRFPRTPLVSSLPGARQPLPRSPSQRISVFNKRTFFSFPRGATSVSPAKRRAGLCERDGHGGGRRKSTLAHPDWLPCAHHVFSLARIAMLSPCSSLPPFHWPRREASPAGWFPGSEVAEDEEGGDWAVPGCEAASVAAAGDGSGGRRGRTGPRAGGAGPGGAGGSAAHG